MAQSVRIVQSAANYFAGALAINGMTGCRPEDIFVFVGSGDSQNVGFNVPSEWNVLHDSKLAGALRHQVYWRQAADIYGTTNFSWTHDHFAYAGAMLSIIGANPVIDQQSFFGANTSTTGGVITGTPITLAGPELLIWACTCDGSQPRSTVLRPEALAIYVSNLASASAQAELLTLAANPIAAGVTPSTACNGSIQTIHNFCATSVFAFKTYYPPQSSSNNPLIFCEM